MSLIGNLEDLSLPDILQIISLSKKSGVLHIRRDDEEGTIFLHQGKVILTSSVKNRRNLGDILMDKHLITRAQLDIALNDQRQGSKELLGLILVKRGVVTQEVLDQIIHEQIEESVFYFLTWREGTFRFTIKEADPRLEVGIDPQVLISQKGIDTQWLVLEGTRLLDERQKIPLPEQQASAAPSADIERDEAALGLLVLVDDDDYFCDHFIEAAAKRGLSVQRIAETVSALNWLSNTPIKKDLAMIVDVVMPSADGRGFLGGMDLAKTILSQHPEVKLKMITAYPDDSIRDELEKMGVPPFALKPELSGDVSVSEVMNNFLEKLIENIRTLPSQPPLDEKHKAAPEKMEKSTASGAAVENIPSMKEDFRAILVNHPDIKQMTLDLIQELQRAQNPSEIGLIVLRLASDVLERAILFKAGRNDVVSIGGFGFEAQDIAMRDGLKNLSINLDHSSILKSAVENNSVIKSEQISFPDNDLLSVVIGSPPPVSWIVIPAESIPASMLILYGDNGDSNKPIKTGDLLCKFLMLSGAYMNKLYQEVNLSGLVATDRAAAKNY